MNTKLLIANCIVNTLFTVFLLIYLLYLKILSKRIDLLEEWRDVVHEMLIGEEDRYGYGRNKTKS